MSSRFERLQRTIGLAIDRVETPALLLDLDAFDRNNKLMNSLCAERHVSWRAHAKAHKSSFLARKQVEAGAVGVCVQKLGEAESLCAGGITDIYVSNEIVCEEKLERLALLAGEHPKVEFSIAVDSMFGLQRLVAALRKNKTKRVVGVLIDFNVGHNRCGCTVDDGIVIAKALKECADVVFFKGIHCYHGSIQHEREASERFAKATAVSEQAAKIRDLMQSVTGVASMVVTGGGTGTLATDLALGVFTEVQPGSFAFMDVDYGKNEQEKVWQNSLFLQSQVMSCSRTHSVCDAGNKTHSLDAGVGPVPVSNPDLIWKNGGDEHGILLPRSHDSKLPTWGELVTFIPGHVDPTFALWDMVVGYRNGLVERIIEIDARARSD